MNENTYIFGISYLNSLHIEKKLYKIQLTNVYEMNGDKE